MSDSFHVIAIIAAFNEEDIISSVIRHLIDNGIDVYLIDNHSTDDTVEEASQWLGRGLLHIERFPQPLSPEYESLGLFDWSGILRRKEQLTTELSADWLIHHDADEFRESPWPGLTLKEAIRWVDKLGYNCINFQVLNFCPVDDNFQRGDDPREYFTFFENGAEFDKVQLKCWKVSKTKAFLVPSGGHEVRFEGRRAFPVSFLLRHYPIRGQRHGLKKVFAERKKRFLESERSKGWHVQYDQIKKENHYFLRDASRLRPFNLDRARLELMMPEKVLRDLAERLVRTEGELDTFRSKKEEQQQALLDKEHQLAQLAAERGQFAQEAEQLQVIIQSQEQALSEKGHQLEQLAAERGQFAQEAEQLQVIIQSQEQALADKDQLVNRIAEDRNRLARDVTELQAVVQQQQETLKKNNEQTKQVTIERERLDREAAQLQTKVRALEQTLEERAVEVRRLKTERGQFEQRAIELQATLRTIAHSQSNLLAQNREELACLIAERGRVTRENNQLKFHVQDLRQRLYDIEESLAWALILKYRRLRDILYPQGTRRRKTYDVLKDSFKRLTGGGPTNLPHEPSGNLGFIEVVRNLWRHKAFGFISLKSMTPIVQSASGQVHEERIRWLSAVQIRGAAKYALFLHPPAAVSYRLHVPRNARFFAWIALLPEVWGQNRSGVEFQISIALLDKKLSLKRKKLIHPTRIAKHRRWVRMEAPLQRFANQEVELTISTFPPKGAGAEFAWAIWGEPCISFRKSWGELWNLLLQHLRTNGFAGSLEKVRAKLQSIGHAGSNSHAFSSPNSAYPLMSSGFVAPERNLEASIPIPMTQAFTSSAPVIRSAPRETIDVKLTVVIPTKNGILEDFESTLRAIHGQRGIADLEIIVVDSGSTDGTVKVAEGYGARIFRIPPEEFNHGLTRNFGAEQGTGEFILFMVQDAIPAADDLIYEMAKVLRADSKLAGVSVRQIPKSNADIYACWEMWNHYRAFFETPRPKLSSLAELDRVPPQQLRQLAGLDNVCAMVRRQIWEKTRFKPTPFAEDLEFGLSCIRQGYSIELLPHRSVIHSHTRSAFYCMARHYIDMLVVLKLFTEPSQPTWVGTLTLGQLLSSIQQLYLGINSFAVRTGKHSTLDPAIVLTDLLSFLSETIGTAHQKPNHAGEARLDKFFTALGNVFEDASLTINPCQMAFQGILNSILQFLGNRYPASSKTDVIALMHKAFACAAGSVLGEYSFWHRYNGTTNQLDILDDLLGKGATV